MIKPNKKDSWGFKRSSEELARVQKVLNEIEDMTDTELAEYCTRILENEYIEATAALEANKENKWD